MEIFSLYIWVITPTSALVCFMPSTSFPSTSICFFPAFISCLWYSSSLLVYLGESAPHMTCVFACAYPLTASIRVILTTHVYLKCNPVLPGASYIHSPCNIHLLGLAFCSSYLSCLMCIAPAVLSCIQCLCLTLYSILPASSCFSLLYISSSNIHQPATALLSIQQFCSYLSSRCFQIINDLNLTTLDEVGKYCSHFYRWRN